MNAHERHCKLYLYIKYREVLQKGKSCDILSFGFVQVLHVALRDVMRQTEVLDVCCNSVKPRKLRMENPLNGRDLLPCGIQFRFCRLFCRRREELTE